MTGIFKVLINGELKVYKNYEDIPEEFENVISFKADVPEPPHTEEEHELIESIGDKFKELMKRETR